MLLATDLAAVDHHEGTITLIANAINWDASDERVDEAYDDAVRPAGPDDRRAGRARARPRSPCTGPAEPEFTRRRRPPSTTPPSRWPRSRSAPARRSRWWCRSGSRRSARPIRSTSTGCCGRPTPARTCTCCGWSPRPASGSTSSAPAPRRWSRSATGRRPRTRSPAPGGAGPPRRRTCCWRRTCAPTRRSAPSTSCSSTSAATTSAGSASRARVKVRNFFSVERYSHVMHLVSTVTGTLRPEPQRVRRGGRLLPGRHAVGAPKPRAMEIIEELEPTRRGLYGGIVGYLDFAGNADTAIAIRTALVRDGVAYVQAGGGIVADSDPVAEDTETPEQGARGAVGGGDRGDAAHPGAGRPCDARWPRLGTARRRRPAATAPGDRAPDSDERHSVGQVRRRRSSGPSAVGAAGGAPGSGRAPPRSRGRPARLVHAGSTRSARTVALTAIGAVCARAVGRRAARAGRRRRGVAVTGPPRRVLGLLVAAAGGYVGVWSCGCW